MIDSTKSRSKFSIKGLILGCSIALLVSLILAFLAIEAFTRSLIITLEPDEVAVLISPYESTGYSEIPLTPGKHMLRPLEKVEIFKASREVFSSSSADCNCGPNSVSLRTKDGADLTIDYQVTYVIDPKQVGNLYRTWRHSYQAQFVIPTSKQVISELASQYTANEIALSKREGIEQAIFTRLESDFSQAYLILLEFKISDVRLKN